MAALLKLFGGLLLLLIGVLGGMVADFAWNDGRILYRLLGRDRIEAACRPELARVLAERGFEPVDIAFETRPSLNVNLGPDARMDSAFTFTDGAGGNRVDGVMTCVASGTEARVDVRVGVTPHRAA